jgi:hypothetical protein
VNKLINYNSWFDDNQKNGFGSSSTGGEYVPPPLVVSFTPFTPALVSGWPRNTPQAILLIVSSGVSARTETPTDEPKVPACEIKQV